MPSCRRPSLVLALCCALLGLVVFIVAFATVAWVSHDYNNNFSSYYFGLWKERKCVWNRWHCETYSGPEQRRDFLDWYRATQAMECIALILFVISTFILFVYFFVDSFKKRNVLVATIILTFVTVVFIIIGVAIFAIKFEDYAYSIGWSMGLAIASAILAFLAAILEIISLQ